MTRSADTVRAGFTILELMVALTVGGIAISSIYAIGSASTRVFRVQNDVSNAQTTLRMAMDQVKRDIARAGYLATPNAAMPGQTCGQIPAGLDAPLPGSGRLAAFSRFDNNVDISGAPAGTGLRTIKNNEAQGFAVDEVVLFANYATSDEYPVRRVLGNANQVRLQHGFYEFQRDFTAWSSNDVTTFDAGAFRDAFVPGEAGQVGRAVRIHLPSRRYVFGTIAQVIDPTAATPVTVQLTNPIDPDCLGDLNGASIAPLSAVRYQVRNAPAAGDEARRFEGSGPMAQLVRSEVNPINKMAALQVPGSNPAAFMERAVLDYVVAFNLEFTMSNANLGGGQADAYVVGAMTVDDSLSAGSVNANPERIRAVTIELAVRTPEQDGEFAHGNLRAVTPDYFDEALCANLRCFQVFTDRPGAARVRSLRAEVFVPNVAAEGY